MTYSIETIDITDPRIESQLIRLYRTAFDSEEVVRPGTLHRNTDISSRSGRVFLAAIEDGKIIGVNGFMWMDGFHNGQNVSFLQSCWTATDPAHQGKRIFPNLMNCAKEFGKAQGAAFLCGVANHNSRPIMQHKLGFSETRTMVSRIPAARLFAKSFLTYEPIELTAPDVCYVDERQVLDLKKREAPEDVIIFRDGESFLWGKMRRKEKWGIRLPYFDVGGVWAAEPEALPALVQSAAKGTRAAYLQFTLAEGHPVQRALSSWRAAQMNGFMFFNLQDLPLPRVAMMLGAIDVF